MENKNITLLIMAAGMGSRFGGLKQIEPVGPNGEFIIDYSINDAVKAGFNKIVFVIKKENLDIFRETIGKRIENKVKVEYVFQELSDIPEEFNLPEERVKPWGTGHAVLSARKVINEPFGVINSDDFYGYDAFNKLANYLKNIESNDKKQYSIICYPLKETLSKYGDVKRGVCKIENDKLVDIIESNIINKDNKLIGNPLSTNEYYEIDINTDVSVNIFGFDTSIFNYLEQEFISFLDRNINDLSAEFLLPMMLAKGVKEDFCDLNIIRTKSTWYGITYKEDTQILKDVIQKKINNNEYKNNLWN